MSDERTAKTVIASIGSVVDFSGFDQAESVLGWRALRPGGRDYTLVQHGGDIRTFPEIGLPRLEQHYAVDGHASLLEFVQEPSAYKSTPPPGDVTTTSIGGWTGQLWHEGAQAGFYFASGESIAGQSIRVTVWGDGFTEGAIRQFVASLDFTSSPPKNY